VLTTTHKHRDVIDSGRYCVHVYTVRSLAKCVHRIALYHVPLNVSAISWSKWSMENTDSEMTNGRICSFAYTSSHEAEPRAKITALRAKVCSKIFVINPRPATDIHMYHLVEYISP